MATDQGRLTDPQIDHLSRAIAQTDLEAIALESLETDHETIENLKLEHGENAEEFNQNLLRRWAKQEGGQNQVQKLASILYRAAQSYGNINPDTVENILGVPNEEILEAQSINPDIVESGIDNYDVEEFTVKDFMTIAGDVKDYTADAMKIKVAPWIREYVFDMDNVFTELTLEKNRDEFAAVNKSITSKDYSEMFREIEDERRKSETRKPKKEQRRTEELNRSFYLSCFHTVFSCFKSMDNDGHEIHKAEKKAGKRFLIKGDLGMGKTILVKTIAYDWARNNFKLFSKDLVLFVFLKFVEPGQTIEMAILDQTPTLKGVSEAKLTKLLEHFGSKCLLILDGLDEHASGKINDDVIEVIKGQKLCECHVLVTARPQSTGQFEQYFNTIVSVEGFTRAEAEKFALKILGNRKKVEQLLKYNPHDFRRDMSLHNCPLLLSFMCLLVREDQIDLTKKIRNTEEIYVRMVRCLYKKYTFRKEIVYRKSDFIKVLKSVGKLALMILLSGNAFLKHSDVIEEVGVDAFDYGLLFADEDFRLIRDETADIFVTFPHSLQEFLGAFFFIWALNEGKGKGKVVRKVLGPDCDVPIFMTNPVFLHFCLWLLFNSQEYFSFVETDNISKTLKKFISSLLDSSLLSFPHLSNKYPAISIENAWAKDDAQISKFVENIFSQFQQVKTLIVASTDVLDWILSSLRPMLESVLHVVMKNRLDIMAINERQSSVHVETRLTLHEQLKPFFGRKMHFVLRPSLYIYLKTALRNLVRFLQDVQQYPKLQKLHIHVRRWSDNGVKSDGFLPPFPNITHLSFTNMSLHRSTIMALCSTIEHGDLPRLTHLTLAYCKPLLLYILLKSVWPKLIHINILGCDLESSDIETLCEALDPSEKRLLPMLSSLALTVDSVYKYSELLQKTKLTLTTLYIDFVNTEANINFIEQMEWENMCALTHLGISLGFSETDPIGLQELKLDMLDEIKTLVLHNCVENSRTLLDIGKKCGNLSFLDISHSRGVRGNLSQLLGNNFPFLTNLVLSDCALNLDDVKSLVQSKIELRLSNLKHLDISDNYLTADQLEYLAESGYIWADLLTLNIAGSNLSEYEADVDIFCSVHEFCVYDFPLEEVTATWPCLRIICLKTSSANVLQKTLYNIIQSVRDRLFPALQTVCIDCDDMRKIWEIAEVRRLGELNVSCHYKIPTVNPFTPYLCICQPERFPY